MPARKPWINRERGRSFVLLGLALTPAGCFSYKLGTLSSFAKLTAFFPTIVWFSWLECLKLFRLLGVILFLSGCVLTVLGLSLDRKTASTVLEEDSRAPVLYLRAFAEDRSGLLPRLGRFINRFGELSSLDLFTAEEHLGKILSRIGPFIALGKPGEKLMTPGAAREYVAEDWREVTTSWVERARVVVIRVGNTENLAWETGLAARLKAPSSILLYLPDAKWPALSLWRRRRLYRSFRRRVALVLKLPPFDEIAKAVFLWFTPSGSPIALGKIDLKTSLPSMEAALDPVLRFFSEDHEAICERMSEVANPGLNRTAPLRGTAG